MLQQRVFLRVISLIAALVVLAACGEGDQPSRATATPLPTVPPVITRVVTPRPTNTPPPPPTPSYDLVPVAGSWNLRWLVEINGGVFADQLSYSGAVNLEVHLDGSISGSGLFWPGIFDVPCNARVVDDEPLRLSVSGTTRAAGDQIWADIQLVPDDANQPEYYEMVCPDYNDIRRQEEPVLWPVLGALNRLQWSFALQSGQTFNFESADLGQDTGGRVEGALIAIVDLNRN